MDFKKEFQAAEIIRLEGIGGANKAVQLVGMSLTITLLILQYKIEEGETDEEILELLEGAGLMRMADISYNRCVIWEEGCRAVAAFEVRDTEGKEDAECVAVPTEGLHIGMWMGGIQQRLFAGNPPYTEIQAILLERHRQFCIEQGLR